LETGVTSESFQETKRSPVIGRLMARRAMPTFQNREGKESIESALHWTPLIVGFGHPSPWISIPQEMTVMHMQLVILSFLSFDRHDQNPSHFASPTHAVDIALSLSS
jgi:hypothetical protein